MCVSALLHTYLYTYIHTYIRIEPDRQNRASYHIHIRNQCPPAAERRAFKHLGVVKGARGEPQISRVRYDVIFCYICTWPHTHPPTHPKRQASG